MQFFSSDKRLQEIFFQNHPPPPSRVKWSAPYLRLVPLRFICGQVFTGLLAVSSTPAYLRLDFVLVSQDSSVYIYTSVHTITIACKLLFRGTDHLHSVTRLGFGCDSDSELNRSTNELARLVSYRWVKRNNWVFITLLFLLEHFRYSIIPVKKKYLFIPLKKSTYSGQYSVVS